MTRVHIDFETRSEVDIWATGAWIYATHPSTQILCVGYAIDDGPIHLLRTDEIQDSLTLRKLATDSGVVFVAHNALFEQFIWKHLMVKKYGFPPIPIKKWRCTAAKAQAYSLPKSLEKSTDAMLLPDRKDSAGRHIMLRMCRPIPTKKKEIYYDNDPKNFRTLYEYCKQDVKVERELDKVLPDLSDQEQEIWFYDQLINTRGVRVDRDTVKTFIAILEAKTSSLNRELIQITNGRVTKGTQVQSMLEFLADTGAKLPDLQKGTVRDAIKSGLLTPVQIQVLRLRQQLGKSSLAKYARFLIASDEEGVLRDNFVYHVASTGRWGGKLVQLQNLPVPKTKIDVLKAIDNINTFGYPAVEMMYPGRLMEVMSACIRGMLVPAVGKELYVGDYGAIEARVLMWLAEEEKGLKEFEATDNGTDVEIYTKMAQRIRNDYTLTKKSHPEERQLGKQAILGCGYGMGGDKFQVTCAGYGIHVENDEAHAIVGLYRTTYFNVKNYWYDMERTVLNAFNAPNTIHTLGRVRWIYRADRDAMFCALPSGRILTYMRPRMIQNRFDSMSISFMTEVNTQWVRRDTYGGKLVENITQATARDIMAYNMPRLEQNGFPILMHTHDEIVSEQKIGAGFLAHMIKLMCVLPPWATGCPIVAEGFITKRYMKG